MLFTVKRGIEIDRPRSDAMRPLHGSVWRKLSRIRPAPDVLSICTSGRTGVWLYGRRQRAARFSLYCSTARTPVRIRFSAVLAKMPPRVVPQAPTDGHVGRTPCLIRLAGPASPAELFCLLCPATSTQTQT